MLKPNMKDCKKVSLMFSNFSDSKSHGGDEEDDFVDWLDLDDVFQPVSLLNKLRELATDGMVL